MVDAANSLSSNEKIMLAVDSACLGYQNGGVTIVAIAPDW